MTLVDTNVLIYAVDRKSAHHHAAKHWLDSALSGRAPVGFAWLALIAFIRIMTNPAITARPMSQRQALDVVDAWLAARSAQILHPGARHAALLRSLPGGATEPTSGQSVSASKLTNDAHLAAIAAHHKATVVTFDTDFGRFPGITWQRPH